MQKRRYLFLESVLYIPTLAAGCNLLSLKKWAKEGIRSEIVFERMDFWKNGTYLGRASDCGNDWMLDIDLEGVTAMVITMSACAHDTQTTEIWHHRLGHLSKKDIQRLPNMALGITIGHLKAEGCLQCAGCLVGKHQRKGSRMPMFKAI